MSVDQPNAGKRQKLDESNTEEEMEGVSTEADDDEDPSTLYPPRRCDVALMTAASHGSVSEVSRLIRDEDADPCFQDFNTGMSVLMAAAAGGKVEAMNVLLNEGAPWNAQDRENRCAGDYAIRNGHQIAVDLLMNHACMSELLLGTILKRDRKEQPLNPTYLASSVAYDGDRLVEEEANLAVMMEWERPLMERHANFITKEETGASVLNVGFGMGIVDEALQRQKPSTHVIIEAHPQVLEKLKSSGWVDKPGVRIFEGRWQDIVPKLRDEGFQFDGVFFDTYAEDDIDLNEFHEMLPSILRVNGRYSFYNGQCPDNIFFHGVACEVIRLQLIKLGFSCEYEAIKVDEATHNELWKGLKRRYWYFDTYYLPKCTRERNIPSSS